ncbi:hypothetical protein POZ03_01300 [Bacteroides uniformis]|uniref:hypothetical protein n=1 Tax=Bacteroides uniformis TaxID=820 RepID=UPI00233EBBA7|nr:hypothetical protein [Bacteroides uniformis]MDC1809092.1 hypothetical protein [Bacteroides uniformis]
MRLNIDCKEPEIILNILRNLYINEEVTLIKRYSSTADFEIKSPSGNETVYPLEGLLDLAEDIPAHKIRIY